MVINIKTIATLFSVMAAIFPWFLFAVSLIDHFVNFTSNKLNLTVHPVLLASFCSSIFPSLSPLCSSLFLFWRKSDDENQFLLPASFRCRERTKTCSLPRRQIQIYVHIHEIICWKVEPNKFALKMGCLHWNMKIYACIHGRIFT